MNRLLSSACLVWRSLRTPACVRSNSIAVISCAAALLLVGGAPAGGHRGVPTAGHAITTSTPLPPPPVWATGPALARFYVIYLAWLQLPPASQPPFSVWIDMQGVTSPHLKAQLLALFLWYSSEHRIPRGYPAPPLGARG